MNLRQLKVARILRVARVVRVMRILKLAKRISGGYERTRQQKYGTLKLDLEIYFLAMFSVIVISSTLIFHVANTSTNGSESFPDIPTAMWWAIVTMTTVGDGDLVPVTVLRRIIAATYLCGLALLAMLMTVLGKAMLAGLFGSTDASRPEWEARDLVEAGEQTIPALIRELARLRDETVISEEEFQRKKGELLARL